MFNEDEYQETLYREDNYDSNDGQEEDDDYYSPTDWDREPEESDQDYEDRVTDLQDWLEHNS